MSSGIPLANPSRAILTWNKEDKKLFLIFLVFYLILP